MTRGLRSRPDQGVEHSLDESKRTEGLLLEALTAGELHAFWFDAATRSASMVPTSAWRAAHRPSRRFAQPFRASPASSPTTLNGRTLYVRAATFRRWLSRLGSNKPRNVPRKLGRPPSYDWKAFSQQLTSLLNARGLPASTSRYPKWKNGSDLERVMLEWWDENYGKDPARSTMAPHIKRCIIDYTQKR
jgi:hypothetical protein